MEGLLETIAARLIARCPSLLQVAPAVDAEAIEQFALSDFAVTALVTPMSETADPVRESAFIVSQRETHRFGVTLAMTWPAGFAAYDAAKSEVKAALRGWSPPGAATPVQYGGARLVAFSPAQEGGRWLHLLDFNLTFRSTYEHQA